MILYNITELVCGGLLLAVSLATLRHIYTGSRSHFAFTLIAFVTSFALFYITDYFERSSNNPNTRLKYSMDFAYYLLYIQSWVFAMKYLESANLSS